MSYYTNVKIGAILISLMCTADAFGALTASITSVNQTQAVLQIQGFSGPCSILLSSSPALTPLHPDVDGIEYTGASTDIGRPDTVTSSDGSTRLVTLGHQTDDRALAVYSPYYYQVSGCGGTLSGTFTTANLSSGTTRTEQSPFNSAKWGNLGLPSFDWTVRKPYIDPMTGVTLVPMTTGVQTWRTGCGSGGCRSSSFQFKDWSGGAGWTSPAGILTGAATTAVASNTNPIDLYADPAPGVIAYDWHRIMHDIGVVVWGAGSSANVADRIIDLCIVINPASGCASNTIQVVLPTGSVAHVSSGSSDLDGAYPAAFPSIPYFGWTASNTPLIHMENQETYGPLTVSGNTLTIAAANLNSTQHFSNALSAGQKIFISGSSCPNQMCTIAGPPAGPGTVNTVEQPGVASGTFRAYGWSIRVWKDNANGTAKIGLQYKLAGSNTPIGLQSGGDICSQVAVTSGDGKTGYLCSLTSITSGFGWLAFIATDGTTRLLSFRYGFSFDDTQGNVFYAGGKNSSGGWTVYKYTYTGDYTTELDYHFTCSSSGDCPTLNDQVSVGVDLMPHSANADLEQQISANQGVTLPAYNASIYGHWTSATGGVGFAGSSGHFAFFCNTYAGQGQNGAGGPGWCAAVDLSQSPAKVVRLVHTLDGTGDPNARFGSLHSPSGVASFPNTLFLSLDSLTTNKTTTLHGGPFQAQVTSVLLSDGVSWSTNTCLDWPAGSGTGCGGTQRSYTACPANSSPYTTCVTLRLPQGGVCNVAATAVEQSNWPCPWNSAYSQFPTMQVGDNAVDTAVFGIFDSEHFRVLSLTPDAGNTLRVVAARNSVFDYCSISPWHGQPDPLSAPDSPSQFLHANGWSFTMAPGTFNTCGAAVLLQDQTSGAVQELGRSLSGHFQIGLGASGLNFVTSTATIFNTPFSDIGKVPPSLVQTGDPSFHGIKAQIGGPLQSYTDDSQLAGAAGYPWAIDMNPFGACGGESLGCGAIRTTTSLGNNIYKVQAIGSAAPSNATYKTQPMIGWAGRYQLMDVSGPASNVDATPYAMCFALLAGECHAGSSANDVFVNVPSAFDPGYCSGALAWVNIPCILFGDNAPAGGIRQFRIYADDPNGAYSRFISNGWSSVGRHYGFSHSVAYRNGQWAMIMGTNLIDGFSFTGFMISLPPWQEKSDSNNDFKAFTAKLPRGLKYAEIEFGYSRYIGPGRSPGNGLFCTSRAEACETATPSSETGAPFAFASETSAPVSCAAGCQISVPVVGSNVVYYRLRRSDDGRRWTTSDVQAVAIP